MHIVSKIKAPKTRGLLGENVENVHSFLKYHLVCQDNVLAYLSCHVIYVTSFDKRSDSERR